MLATYVIEMEDGTTWKVRADQRDAAEFELQPFGVPTLQFVDRIHTYSRFRAWNASHRQKLTELTWEQFNEQCVDVDSPEEEPEDGQDPGQPVASAGS